MDRYNSNNSTRFFLVALWSHIEALVQFGLLSDCYSKIAAQALYGLQVEVECLVGFDKDCKEEVGR